MKKLTSLIIGTFLLLGGNAMADNALTARQKSIAEAARTDIEEMLDAKVFAEMFVKVRKNWRNDPLTMNDIGYNAGKNLR